MTKIILPDDHHYSFGKAFPILLHIHNSTMSVIVILLIASISVAGLFLIGFIWSVKSGQYDDDYSPSSRILFDDDIKKDRAGNANQTIKNIPKL